ncbi:MAG: hypothetical protein F6K23_32040 [Okeania sp. SIO2C9]|uniref:hypothetical protein n=1 Tax=Okeania sp. SIO2C9 TaxID=2607791 RepID=UPI0013C22DB8|nr:hypothetical protein [Okeania sp. SIO2C9]NEQ77235.1 hypothetical protein [Okeania sp. SIO2C9]
MTSALIQEIYFLADDIAHQGFKSLANSLSHLKMTLEEYAIFFIFRTYAKALYIGSGLLTQEWANIRNGNGQDAHSIKHKTIKIIPHLRANAIRPYMAIPV